MTSRKRIQMHFDVATDDQASSEQHESRLHALGERLDRDPTDLLNDALADLLGRHEGKSFGGLLASESSPDSDRPLVHARLLSEGANEPLCGQPMDRGALGALISCA